MDEFILLFRMDIITREAQPSPEQLEVYMKQPGLDRWHSCPKQIQWRQWFIN